MDWLEDRAIAVITGAGVGDALGGATEGWSPTQIEERYGGRVRGIVGPFLADWRTARPIAPYHKGDGHVTDDTLMTRALVEVYAERRAHLDAYAVADDLVPAMMTTPQWMPELEAEALLLQRVFLAEKWLVARLHYGHVDPREAGVGQHRQLRRGDVHRARRRGQRRRPAGCLPGGDRHRRRPPVQLRQGGCGGVRRGRGRGGGRPVPGWSTWWTPRWRSRTTGRAAALAGGGRGRRAR